MPPAMAAGITDRLWSRQDIVARINADAPAPKPREPPQGSGYSMTFWGWVLAAAAIVILSHELLSGWRSGHIRYRAIEGDREKSPRAYWLLMGLDAALILGVLLAVMGIYGEQI